MIEEKYSSDGMRTMFWIFFTIIALSPVFFGANRPWVWLPISVLLGGLSVIFFIRSFKNSGDARISFSDIRYVMIIYGIFLVYVAIQTIPGLSSGGGYQDVLVRATDALRTPLAGSISLNHWATVDGLIRHLMYAVAFILAIYFGASKANARKALAVLLVAASANALYGLLMKFFDIDWILWVQDNQSPNGTFINRNHFATYCGIFLVVSFGLLVKRYQRALGEYDGDRNRYKRLIECTFSEKTVLLLFSFLVLSSAILMSGSRAGAAAAGCGIVMMIFTLVVDNRFRGKGLILSGIGTIFVVLITIASSNLEKRLGFIDESYPNRLIPWEITIDIIADSPLLGTGGGTFEDVYRIHRPTGFSGTMNAAHNSFLESALEYGVIQTILLIAIFFMVLMKCIWVCVSNRRFIEIPAIGASVIVVIGVHSFFDFSMQIPAIALTAVTIMAIGLSQAIRESKGSSRP